MSLQEDLEILASCVPESVAAMRGRLPDALLREAFELTGTATLRKRRLPAEQVVWLILGMAIMSEKSIEDVVMKLDLALPAANGKAVASSSITDARSRVGPEPVQYLFEMTGAEWAAKSAAEHQWRGLSIFGIDGSTLRVHDSDENREVFGGQRCDETKGDSGYPMARIVALMALRSHLILAASIDGYAAASELALTPRLLKQIPDNSLTVLDRNFVSPLTLLPISTHGANRHWLTRAKSNAAMKTVEHFGAGDAIVEMTVTSAARKKNPELPARWRARAITYQRKGHKPQTLLTSLMDPKLWPSQEIVEMYHERWELELGFDEVKTKLRDRAETLRSRKADMIMQEIYGILLAYNLVRLEMAAVAKVVNLPPTRVSFVLSLALIRDEWLWSVITKSPGAIPKQLERLRSNLARLTLPPRRTERSYPRVVKVKMSNYARKRPKKQEPTA
jgi:hypothetical protein